MKKFQKRLLVMGILCTAVADAAACAGGDGLGIVSVAEAADSSFAGEPEMNKEQNDSVRLPVETWTTDSGDQYTGINENGNILGYGKVTYCNGNSYEGYFAKETNEKKKYGVYRWEEDEYKGWYYAGNFAEDAREGYGVIYDSSGAQYAGEYRNDKRDGYGIAFDADGTVAQAGVWEAGKYKENADLGTWTDESGNQWYGTRNAEGNLEGKGICVMADGTCRIGIFGSNGLMYSQGFEYSSESFYIGNFSAGKKDGYGILRLTSGSIWQEGNFVDGSLSGYGISRYSAGWYEGEWKDGTVDGMGARFFANGSLDCAGEWKMGEYQENGALETWTDQDDNWYAGKKDGDGLIQGEGIKIWKGGTRNIGSFQAGVLQAIGAGFFANGNWYSGEWKDGQMNGYGRFYYSSNKQGIYYEGNLVDNERMGYGAYVWVDGERFEGTWSDNAKTDWAYSLTGMEIFTPQGFGQTVIIRKTAAWRTGRMIPVRSISASAIRKAI